MKTVALVALVVFLMAGGSFAAPAVSEKAAASNDSSGAAASDGHSSSGGSVSASSGTHAGTSGGHSGVTSGSAGRVSGGSPQVRPGMTRPVPYAGSAQPSRSHILPNRQRSDVNRLPGRRDLGQRRLPVDPETSRQPSRSGLTRQPRISRPTELLHQRERGKTSVLTTRDGKPHEGNWSRDNPKNKVRFDRQTRDRLRNWQGQKPTWAEACHRHDDHHRHHHDRNWWHHHCDVVILVDWGFWGWSDGWWYPAWGYDPYYSYYEYDGPIYGCGDLLPDEIVADVQSELQRLGYYPYEVDGIFGPLTQEALAQYQRDAGIPVTGAIDPPTLDSLGLN